MDRGILITRPANEKGTHNRNVEPISGKIAERFPFGEPMKAAKFKNSYSISIKLLSSCTYPLYLEAIVPANTKSKLFPVGTVRSHLIFFTIFSSVSKRGPINVYKLVWDGGFHPKGRSPSFR